MIFSTGIFFEKRHSDLPDSADLIGVYKLFKDKILELGVEPNWFSASDGKTRTQYRKFNGKFHKKVLDKNFAGYESVSLVVTAPESNAPAWESFIDFGFEFSSVGQITEMSIVIYEPYLDYASVRTEKLVREFSQIWPWDFGFAIKRDVERSPLMYLTGGSTNEMTSEDDEHLDKWYFSSHKPETRLTAIRDVFAYNVIGLGHLNRQLPSGKNVRQLIGDDAYSSLAPLTNDLWLWKVEDDKIENVRKKLLGSGFILTE